MHNMVPLSPSSSSSSSSSLLSSTSTSEWLSFVDFQRPPDDGSSYSEHADVEENDISTTSIIDYRVYGNHHQRLDGIHNTRRQRRQLATLFSSDQNETISPTGTSDDQMMSSYQPTSTVHTMHRAPRFGNSNHLGLVLSSNPDAPIMYTDGLKQFSLFILVPFLLWGMTLLILKWSYGVDRVGWAAGGETLDMYRLSKHHGLNRTSRKRRIARSWRIQSVFMVSSVLIPVVTVIMVQTGLTTVTVTMDELKDLVDDIESLAYRGMSALQGIDLNVHHLLNDNEFVMGIIQYTQPSDGFFIPITTNETTDETTIGQMNNMTGTNFRDDDPTHTDSIFATEWCPNAEDYMGDLLFLADSFQMVQDNANAFITTIDGYLGGVGGNVSVSSSIDDALITVTETTGYIDSTMDWFLAHDWILKLILLLLNVVNILLLLSVYCLSKNNIIHDPTRAYQSWILVPLFTVLAVFLVIFTLTTGIIALINADFCSGGSDPGSPQGTVEDAILSVAQYGNLDRTAISNYLNGTTEDAIPETVGMVYEALIYYSSGCLIADDPLSFLQEISNQIDTAVTHTEQLSSVIPMGNNQTLDVLTEACGSNLDFLPSALDDLHIRLSNIRQYVGQLVETGSCNQISPLLRRVSYGGLCTDFPYGWTALWSCSLSLSILSFIMLTTRAALYNSVKPKKQRDKKPRRVVEKEFAEYKDHMRTYYDDADDWKLHEAVPEPKFTKTKVRLEFDTADLMLGLEGDDDNNQVKRPPTFETKASSDTPETDLDSPMGSDRESVNHIPKTAHSRDETIDDDSYGSSYESEVSDDDKSVDGEQSAFVSFIADTKSIAMQTIMSIQNVRPLLRRSFASGASFIVAVGRNRRGKELDGKALGDVVPEEGIDGVFLNEETIAEQKHVEDTTIDSTYLATTRVYQEPSSPGLRLPSLPTQVRECTTQESLNLLTVDDSVMNHDRDGIPTSNDNDRNKAPTNKDDKKHQRMSFGQSARKGKTLATSRFLMETTPSNNVTALTPTAPRKKVPSIARTNDGVGGQASYFNTLCQSHGPSPSSSPVASSARSLQMKFTQLPLAVESSPATKKSRPSSRQSSTKDASTMKNQSEMSRGERPTTNGATQQEVPVWPRAPKKTTTRYIRTRLLSEDDV